MKDCVINACHAKKERIQILFDINMKPEIQLSFRKNYKENEATKEKKRERQET